MRRVGKCVMLERSEASLPGWALMLFASLKSDHQEALGRNDAIDIARSRVINFLYNVAPSIDWGAKLPGGLNGRRGKV